MFSAMTSYIWGKEEHNVVLMDSFVDEDDGEWLIVDKPEQEEHLYTSLVAHIVPSVSSNTTSTPVSHSVSLPSLHPMSLCSHQVISPNARTVTPSDQTYSLAPSLPIVDKKQQSKGESKIPVQTKDNGYKSSVATTGYIGYIPTLALECEPRPLAIKFKVCDDDSMVSADHQARKVLDFILDCLPIPKDQAESKDDISTTSIYSSPLEHPADATKVCLDLLNQNIQSGVRKYEWIEHEETEENEGDEDSEWDEYCGFRRKICKRRTENGRRLFIRSYFS